MHEPEIAFLIVDRLRAAGIRSIITGSIAAIIYGEPRMTHDIDLIVTLRGSDALNLASAFESHEFYCPPLDVISVEAVREHRGHINVIHIGSGFKADIYFDGRDPFHTWAFANKRQIQVEGRILEVAPPEYVIVRKLEFYREGRSEKHLRDIRLMLKMSSEAIDVAFVEQQARERGLTEVWQLVSTPE